MTKLEFRAGALLKRRDDSEPYGKPVAELLASGLPAHGLIVEGISDEDWGWRVSIAHAEFPLWIGCGHYEEYADGWICFIEPSKPTIRRWFSRVDTTPSVQRVADAMLAILKSDGRVSELRWWTDKDGLTDPHRRVIH